MKAKKIYWKYDGSYIMSVGEHLVSKDPSLLYGRITPVAVSCPGLLREKPDEKLRLADVNTTLLLSCTNEMGSRLLGIDRLVNRVRVDVEEN
jgi:hypothetical protein